MQMVRTWPIFSFLAFRVDFRESKWKVRVFQRKWRRWKRYSMISASFSFAFYVSKSFVFASVANHKVITITLPWHWSYLFHQKLPYMWKKNVKQNAFRSELLIEVLKIVTKYTNLLLQNLKHPKINLKLFENILALTYIHCVHKTILLVFRTTRFRLQPFVDARFVCTWVGYELIFFSVCRLLLEFPQKLIRSLCLDRIIP